VTCAGLLLFKKNFLLVSEKNVHLIKYSLCKTDLVDVRFEVFIAVAIKNAVFWDITPRGSCKNRSFGRTYHLHYQVDKNR
jgi:hypothetical protein